MKGLAAAQLSASHVNFHSKGMHEEQVAPAVITYTTGFGSAVMLPWSFYVIKAKHDVNVNFIFNITHFKKQTLFIWPQLAFFLA